MTPVPTTRAGAPGADPFDQAHLAARELLRHLGEPRPQVLVVLGTGLTGVASLLGATGSPVDLSALPWFHRYTGHGHRPEAWTVTIGGLRVLIFSGRHHLYEGLSPDEVVHPLRTALAAGCTDVVLTCSAGGIRPDLAVGQIVAVSDHLNLTGASPLRGLPADHRVGSPFVDLVDAWSPDLRALAAEVAPGLTEGVYAQVPGPQLETPAEIRLLASLGADLVGMSMVPEVVATRHLGARALGLAVVSNKAAGVEAGPFRVDELIKVNEAATTPLAHLVAGVIEHLGDSSAK